MNKQILQIVHKQLRIPTGIVEELNSGLPRRKPGSNRVEGLNQRPPDDPAP